MVAVNYLWNPINDNIVREFDDDGATVAEYTTEPDLYGNVVSQYRNGQTSYLVSDGQGNTTELTNDAGNVTDTIRYSAFGEVTGRTGSTETPFQYVGQQGYYRDGETGEYSVRRRTLLSIIARWVSVDPLGRFQHVPHEYVYVANNPARYIDSSGLELVHKPIGTEGCGEKELDEIRAGLKEACEFLNDVRSARCLPKELKDCLVKVCRGTVLTKCIKECDPTKMMGHTYCARARLTADGKWFSDPKGDTRCESSVPDDATPVIEFCYTVKNSPGKGLSNPKECQGAPDNVMQVVFHELMHFCGSMHKLDARRRPIVEGDLVFGCMKRCFGTGEGDPKDCACC